MNLNIFRSSRNHLIATVLALTLGATSVVTAQSIQAIKDGLWIANACHDPANAGRSAAECCGAKCGEWDTGYDLDLCIATCLAAY